LAWFAELVRLAVLPFQRKSMNIESDTLPVLGDAVVSKKASFCVFSAPCQPTRPSSRIASYHWMCSSGACCRMYSMKFCILVASAAVVRSVSWLRNQPSNP
jgi:hypothetical protein